MRLWLVFVWQQCWPRQSIREPDVGWTCKKNEPRSLSAFSIDDNKHLPLDEGQTWKKREWQLHVSRSHARSTVTLLRNRRSLHPIRVIVATDIKKVRVTSHYGESDGPLSPIKPIISLVGFLLSLLYDNQSWTWYLTNVFHHRKGNKKYRKWGACYGSVQCAKRVY